MQPNKYFFFKIFSHHYLEIKSKGPSHSSSGAFGSLLPFLSRRKTCPVFVKWDVILRNRKAYPTHLEFGHFFLPLPFGERPSSGKAKLGKGKKATVRQLPGWLEHMGLNVREEGPLSLGNRSDDITPWEWSSIPAPWAPLGQLPEFMNNPETALP